MAIGAGTNQKVQQVMGVCLVAVAFPFSSGSSFLANTFLQRAFCFFCLYAFCTFTLCTIQQQGLVHVHGTLYMISDNFYTYSCLRSIIPVPFEQHISWTSRNALTSDQHRTLQHDVTQISHQNDDEEKGKDEERYHTLYIECHEICVPTRALFW